MKVFIITKLNIEVISDGTTLSSVYSALEFAFIAAIQKAEEVRGNEITVHIPEGEELPIDTEYEVSNQRLSDHRSMGTDYGISYKSHYGGYTMNIMIHKRDVKQLELQS